MCDANHTPATSPIALGSSQNLFQNMTPELRSSLLPACRRGGRDSRVCDGVHPQRLQPRRCPFRM
eukprot:7389750-Prymnesium_polylepis.2